MIRVAALALVVAACRFPTPSEDYACVTTDDCEAGRVCELSLVRIVKISKADGGRDTSDPMTVGTQ